MKILYAPWRSLYAKSTHIGKQENAYSHDCAFCLQLAENNDSDHFILRRFKYNFICLNKYPYNAGHCMILPLQHVKEFHEMPVEARVEMMELMSQSIPILQDILEAHGINIGANLGKAAGAGIPSHLHMHILPRWHGDTNFLPTLSEVKLISFDLNDIFAKLKPEFEKLTI